MSSNLEVTVTFTLEETAAVMGLIDLSLITSGDSTGDAVLVLATAGTKLTEAFRTRNDTE